MDGFPPLPEFPPHCVNWLEESELQARELAMRDERLSNRMEELYERSLTWTSIPPLTMVIGHLRYTSTQLDAWNNNCSTFHAEYEQFVKEHASTPEEGPQQELALLSVSQMNARHTHEYERGLSLCQKYNLLHDLMESMVVAGQMEEMDRISVLQAIQIAMDKHPMGGDLPIIFETNQRSKLCLTQLKQLLEFEISKMKELTEQQARTMNHQRNTNEQLQKKVTALETQMARNTTLILDALTKQNEYTRTDHLQLSDVWNMVNEIKNNQARTIESTTMRTVHKDSSPILHDIKGQLDKLTQKFRHINISSTTAKEKEMSNRSTAFPHNPTHGVHDRNKRSEDNHAFNRDYNEKKNILHTAEQKVRSLKEMIRDQEENLRHRKYRRFGEGVLVGRDRYIICVFCHERGKHFSDGCTEMRSVAERQELVEREKRCHMCLDKGCNSDERCPKWNQKCFFCESYKHHSAICDLPDQWQLEEQKLAMNVDSLEYAEAELDRIRESLQGEQQSAQSTSHEDRTHTEYSAHDEHRSYHHSDQHGHHTTFEGKRRRL